MMKKLFAVTAFVLMTATGYAANSDTPFNIVEKNPIEGVEGVVQLLDEDRFEGKEDAPIQIIEYASLTCGHCADFHLNTYPKLKENYIDTGKVRFTLRPMPWDNRALAVSLVAFCAPKAQYKDFMSAYFSTQQQWSRSDKFLEDIKKIARLGGMDGKAVEQCVSDPEVRRTMDAIVKTGTEDLAVRATPTFFINGKKVEGSLPYTELANYLDDVLANKEK